MVVLAVIIGILVIGLIIKLNLITASEISKTHTEIKTNQIQTNLSGTNYNRIVQEANGVKKLTWYDIGDYRHKIHKENAEKMCKIIKLGADFVCYGGSPLPSQDIMIYSYKKAIGSNCLPQKYQNKNLGEIKTYRLFPLDIQVNNVPNGKYNIMAGTNYNCCANLWMIATKKSIIKNLTPELQNKHFSGYRLTDYVSTENLKIDNDEIIFLDVHSCSLDQVNQIVNFFNSL